MALVQDIHISNEDVSYVTHHQGENGFVTVKFGDYPGARLTLYITVEQAWALSSQVLGAVGASSEAL